MDIKTITIFQLFLRLALSGSFLSAVADRFGMWGKPGDDHVVWGNWGNFVLYSNSVNSYAGSQLNNLMAIGATCLELLLPVLLLAGYKLRLTSIVAGLLLLAFGLAMTYSFGSKPALDYSVWTSAAAAFLLSSCNRYRYSIDNLLLKTNADR